MSSDFDASVKLLYAVDVGTFFTIDDVTLNDPFDVIMNIEIGRDLNQNVTRFDARVGIRNLTQSVNVATANQGGSLTPSDTDPFLQELRINIPAGWGAKAAVGDVLQAVASYKVTAGSNFDFSTAESLPFVVS
ncbi:hypothetical protein BAY61_10185 [Prauserella marina]|uniref:Uncharacterized protein n=2 Tax=Prauserella marina TaxID=530584 RepID=A0A222VN83_9PSEU|nr:hypothetical protein BAY61_10185 [Prauserella marina]PWV84918.1 hypothetical protein DES30_101937 [Prauserella marina]SDC09492.1 hypothetical protein SAMN05421630_101400 [Prauserella marina]